MVYKIFGFLTMADYVLVFMRIGITSVWLTRLLSIFPLVFFPWSLGLIIKSDMSISLRIVSILGLLFVGVPTCFIAIFGVLGVRDM
jgi:hypothetical protein